MCSGCRLPTARTAWARMLAADEEWRAAQNSGDARRIHDAREASFAAHDAFEDALHRSQFGARSW